MAKAKKENELRLVRAFSAPVQLVWEAFTDENHQAKWWGPRGFTITTKSKSLTPGGQWIYTMHGPDGTDYPNIATYYVVEEYSKLVYDHGATESTPPLFRVTVTFEEFKGRTVMDMTMELETPEAAREIEKFIKQAGGNSTWDRLSEYLEAEQRQKDIFVINRSFEADLETMFDLWTKPEHFCRWMGPTGSSMEFLETDVRVGGINHYKMSIAEGSEMYGLIEYKEIDAPQKLVYMQCFCDENKVLCKPPFSPNWPDRMLTTVLFNDEGDGHIRITLKWEIHGEATDEERRAFHDEKPGMTIGWTGSFDKLEEALSRGL